MADSDKNILITPNRGSSTADPNIVFTGGDNNPITLTVLDDGTLSFSGSAGQLFSVSDNLSGTIFSVNDVSGVPSIEVDDTGEVRIAEFGGNVLIGTATDSGQKLQVEGDVNINGTFSVNGAPLTVEYTNSNNTQDEEFGDGANAGNYGASFGYNATSGTNAVAIGSSSQANSDSVSVGYLTYAQSGGVAIGKQAKANQDSIAIGENTDSSSSTQSILIGYGLNPGGANNVFAIGSLNNALSTINNDTAVIGSDTTSSSRYSRVILFGADTDTATAGQVLAWTGNGMAWVDQAAGGGAGGGVTLFDDVDYISYNTCGPTGCGETQFQMFVSNSSDAEQPQSTGPGEWAFVAGFVPNSNYGGTRLGFVATRNGITATGSNAFNTGVDSSYYEDQTFGSWYSSPPTSTGDGVVCVGNTTSGYWPYRNLYNFNSSIVELTIHDNSDGSNQTYKDYVNDFVAMLQGMSPGTTLTIEDVDLLTKLEYVYGGGSIYTNNYPYRVYISGLSLQNQTNVQFIDDLSAPNTLKIG